MTVKKLLLLFIALFILLNSLDFYIEELGSESNGMVEKKVSLKLTQFDGSIFDIQNTNSELYLIDFWFSSCIPCVQEMKKYPDLIKKYGDKLTIVSYSWEKPEVTKKLLNNKPNMWSFLELNNPQWKFCNQVNLEDSLVEKFRITQYPSYVLLDKEFNIVSFPNNSVIAVNEYFGDGYTIVDGFFNYLDKYSFDKLIISTGMSLLLMLLIRLIFFLKKKIVG